MFRVLLLTLSALLTAACNSTSLCGETKQNLTHEDGGTYRCLRPEDCPRPANVFVCATDVITASECVSCSDTICVRHLAEPCP